MSGVTGRVVSAQGVLARFNEAGILEAPDVHTAQLVARTAGEHDPAVLLGAALTMRALRAGSVCLPIRRVRRLAQFFVRDDDAQAGLAPQLDELGWPDPDRWLAALAASSLVGDEHSGPNEHPLRLVDEALYLERYWHDEESITAALLGRCGPFPDVDEARLERSLAASPAAADRRDEAQRTAVRTAVRARTAVICGGPGTGKTTVVRGMIAVLESQGLSVLLGAPTGRAAKRLAEATGRKAETVHRLLGAQGGIEADGSPVFEKDADDPLDADAIILDEVSMMDIVLMEHFLEAVPEGARVILVGDVDQLPAVGPGSVLKDILRSGAVPSVRLKEVFRQSGEGTIVLNAHAINRGRMPQFTAGGDFEFLEMPDEEATARRIVALCREELPREGFNALEDVQVLSPMHRTPCGVDNLNRLLQAALNPPAPEKAEFRNSTLTFRVGDKVMQTKNDYTKGVFNGDIGFIREVSADGVKVRYSDELTADYEPNELMMLTLAYAMSVHKSQGSEYPVIVLPLVAAHHIMLQRNLLYTAVTRAKKKVVLLGSKAAVFTAVSNDRTRRRYTLLAERLAGAGGESPLLS